MRREVMAFWDHMAFAPTERTHFARVVQNDIRQVPVEDLRIGGYVIEVLESGIWSVLAADTFADTLRAIIVLGHDTDTAAAIAGGLAALYYGREGMPAEWVEALARKDEIVALGEGLGRRYGGVTTKDHQRRGHEL